MKTTIIMLSIFFCTSLCMQAQNLKSTSTEKTYLLNPDQSVLNWKGSYSFNFSEYNGTVAFKKGKLYTKEGDITGGTFIIDMTTITTPEHTLDASYGPVEHLKNSDFFDVTKYPEATLELTQVTYYNDTNEHRLEGDLTIKNVTKPIIVRAFVNDTNKSIKTRFKLDRREWEINYQSKFKDSAISNAMEFDVILKFE